MTIYPETSEKAENIMTLISAALAKYPGPIIQSDFRCNDSKNTFFRYGAFKADGHEISGPNGEVYVDYPVDYPMLPEWIELPSGWVTENPINLLQDFSLKGIYRKRHSGNVYLANRNHEAYVIKEARRYLFQNGNFLVTDLRRAEANISNLENYFPDLIGQYDEDFATYYVYKFVSGQSLSEWKPTKGIVRLSDPVESENVIKSILGTVQRLAHMMDTIKQDGLSNLDLHLSNVLIDKDNNLYLVDGETINESTLSIQTPGFWFDKMKDMSPDLQDRFRFIFIVFALFGGGNRFANVAPFDKILSAELNYMNRLGIAGGTSFFEKIQHTEIPLTEAFADLKFKGVTETVSGISPIVPPRFDTKTTIDWFFKAEQDLQSLKQRSNEVLRNLQEEQEFNWSIYESRIQTDGKSRKVLLSVDGTYVDPYIQNGQAGLLLMIFLLPESSWPNFTNELLNGILTTSAKDLGYINGLTGIAYVLMTHGYLNNNDRTYLIGIQALKNVRQYLTLIDGKWGIPNFYT